MVGATVSHYRILERLGGGGMGVVYKARDLKLDRTVALKFLPPDLTRDASARERFIHEAQAASALDHPHICNIHEIDETPDSRTFLCMAFYDGASVKNEIEKGPMEIGRVLDVAVQVAEGLSRAHEAGIIHRDIKPANIMVTSRGEVKIIDFGLAKLAGQTTLTGAQHLLGTAAYMSPEQVRGDQVDRRTDIWSFGTTLYEMLSAIHPFKCDNREATFYSILSRDPKPLAEIRGDVPANLERIIACCLEKEPADRFPSIAPMLEELKAVRAEWCSSKPLKRRRRNYPRAHPRRLLRKWRVPLSLGTILVGGAVGWILLFGRPGSVFSSEGKHLVVLPFTNVGHDSSCQALCDGLWETSSCKLTQLEQFDGSLWVVPNSEVRKRRITSASDARGEFGVNLAFANSIQLERDVLMIALNLVDTRTLRQVRSALLTERMSNVSSIQVDVISKMAQMLEFEFHPQAQRTLAAGGTVIAGAYEHYLKGCGLLVRSSYRIDSLAAAITEFTLAIDKDPHYALAYSGLGEAYWTQYRSTKDVHLADLALENCERALAIDSELPRVHVTMGLVHAGRGRYQEALRDFRRALAKDSVNSDAFREMARTYSAMGDSLKAEQTYRRAIALKPGYWDGYNALGAFYYSQGRYDKAIEQFEEVVRLTPRNTKGYNNLGAVRFLAGRWEDASKAWEQSLAIDATRVVYSQLGTLYFYTGRFAEASEMFRRALAESETDPRIWGNLAASLYWVPERRPEALETYAKAAELTEEELRVNPLDEEVLTNLASYYAMLGNRNRTLELIRQVCSSELTNPDIMERVADAYEHIGERDSAVVWIGRAIKAGYSIRMLNAAPGMKTLREDSRVKSMLHNSNE